MPRLSGGGGALKKRAGWRRVVRRARGWVVCVRGFGFVVVVLWGWVVVGAGAFFVVVVVCCGCLLWLVLLWLFRGCGGGAPGDLFWGAPRDLFWGAPGVVVVGVGVVWGVAVVGVGVVWGVAVVGVGVVWVWGCGGSGVVGAPPGDLFGRVVWVGNGLATGLATVVGPYFVRVLLPCCRCCRCLVSVLGR